MAAAAASPWALSGCADATGWRDVNPRPVAAEGYGRDPDLMNPETPWPLTLSEEQRGVVRICADIILPGDDTSPGAGSLGVDSFVDEWVSAPYEQQQGDRALLLSGLAWLDREARSRFSKRFDSIEDAERRAMFDDIAFADRVKEGHERQAAFFARLRGLIMAGFYTLPEGIADIGYMGNSPILGPYPGPSREALAHLREKLAELGLSMP
jgi:hypothetical protein